MLAVKVMTTTGFDGYDYPVAAHLKNEIKGEWVPLFTALPEDTGNDWSDATFEVYRLRFLTDPHYQIDPQQFEGIEKVLIVSARDKGGYYIPIFAVSDEALADPILKWWERSQQGNDYWSLGYYFKDWVELIKEG